MPFYRGKSKDGSDMEEVEGMYVNPNNENQLLDYMNGRYTLNDVYYQIKNKICKLSYRLRQYVLSHYDENGNFLYDK